MIFVCDFFRDFKEGVRKKSVICPSSDCCLLAVLAPTKISNGPFVYSKKERYLSIFLYMKGSIGLQLLSLLCILENSTVQNVLR